MRYFNYKFSKIAFTSAAIAPAPHQAPILVTWSCVICSNFGFSNGLWRNRTLIKSVMTSFQWRHRYYITKTSPT